MQAQEFLASYWQKQPLLLPAAIADLEPRISPQDLAWLATQDDVESRLVFVQNDGNKATYSVENGPFEETRLANLPETNWSLLIQDVEKHLPDFRSWLKAVEFIPDWRIDDLMISVSAPGGSVGPHSDNYDVFLCQSMGIRQWQIEKSENTSLDENSNDLALLMPFDGLHTHLLDKNDVLYLPPGMPHWGIAKSLSITCSIGMRAPSKVELCLAQERLEIDENDCTRPSEPEQDSLRYCDADLDIGESAPGMISNLAVARVRDQGLLCASASDEMLAKTIGVAATDPKAWLDPERLSRRVAEQMLRNIDENTAWDVHGMGRLAWHESDVAQVIFVNGTWLDVDSNQLDAFKSLCAARKIRPLKAGYNLLLWLLQNGCFDLQGLNALDEE